MQTHIPPHLQAGRIRGSTDQNVESQGAATDAAAIAPAGAVGLTDDDTSRPSPH